MINYGKQYLDKEDLKAVEDVLKSDFLTTGPKVKKFEEKFASYVGSKYAVAVANGTAGLHLTCLAANLKKNKEIITTPITFAASANCALYCGAKPIFVDIKENGLIDESLIKNKISKDTKIIIPVHYSGIPCDMEKINKIAKKYDLTVIEDACHALGSRYKRTKIGDCKYSDMAVFSFHPVKHITTGEGGMITTNSKKFYKKLLLLRNHGITKDSSDYINKNQGPWYHEMQLLGFNYRLSDINCALGISQLSKINNFISKRKELAYRYDKAFKNYPHVNIIEDKSSYHLYIIRVKQRQKLFKYLKEKNIFCQVHYIPVYLHPYYQKIGYKKGECPLAEKFYSEIISLPIYYSLTKKEQDKIIYFIKRFFS